MASYRIPFKPLTENGPQLVSNFFVAVCRLLWVNNITITEHHKQTSGQRERFNCNLFSQLRHYVSEQKTDLDTYLLPLTYSYNIQVQRAINMPLFSMAVTQAAPGPAKFVSKSVRLASDDDLSSPVYVRLEVIRQTTDIRREDDKNLRLAQLRYKKDRDHDIRLAPIFRADNYICLDRLPLFRSAAEKSDSKGFNKLIPRKQGSFKVTGEMKYILRITQDDLENTASIHQTIVSRTSRSHCDENRVTETRDPEDWNHA